MLYKQIMKSTPVWSSFIISYSDTKILPDLTITNNRFPFARNMPACQTCVRLFLANYYSGRTRAYFGATLENAVHQSRQRKLSPSVRCPSRVRFNCVVRKRKFFFFFFFKRSSAGWISKFWSVETEVKYEDGNRISSWYSSRR